MKKESKKRLKRIGIMGGIFIAALIVYFVWSFNSMEKSNTVYTSMAEPRMPVAYVETNGTRINPMHAYVQDMGNQAARDSITVLPQDRQLTISVDEYDSMAASVQYEIRSLDLTQLIENGTVSDYTRENGTLHITLPIQNLIKKDTEYLLALSLDTGEQMLHYYTRILWTDNNYADAMLALATSFTEKTFDYNAARDLTQYLETSDTADNSDLGHVTLESSFSQLTWGGTGMQQDGTPLVTLKECAGVMGEIQIRYNTKRTAEDGTEEHYQNEDNYVFRYDPQRIFIMDFDRKTSELFSGQPDDFSKDRLLLGVSDASAIQTMESNSGRFIAFRTDQELWRYDNEAQTCVRVFTYRSDTDDGVRTDYPEHDIKILSCKDNGDVDFLVYGYINRGRHEGVNGIVYYTYDNSEDTVAENFFVPAARPFEQIQYDVERLSFISGKGMLYLLQQGSVYGIDINSQEIITVVSGLDDGAFAASANNDRIAWQNGGIGDADESITLFDLTQDQTSVIKEDNAYVRALGFIGDDFVYGICSRDGAEHAEQVMDLPLLELRILAPDGTVQTSYQKDGLYLTNVQVEGDRVRINLSRRLEDGSFVKTGEDTIVSNQAAAADKTAADHYADNVKGRVYYLPIQNTGAKQVRVRAPERVSYENTASLELNTGVTGLEEGSFYAYAHGHFVGKTRKLGAAVSMVYAEQGYVTDSSQNLLWNRSDRETIVNVKDPQDTAAAYLLNHLDGIAPYARYDDVIVMDGDGLTLSSALYFVGKGMPVVAFNADGGNYLIAGYDQFNITLINPLNGEKQLMGRNDAEAYFEAQGNRFAVAVRVGG